MKKQIFRGLIILVNIVTLCYCSNLEKEVNPESNTNPLEVSFQLKNNLTRVIDNAFENGDNIIVDAYESNGNIYADDIIYTYENGSFVAKGTPIIYKDETQSLRFDLVYPKKENLSNNFIHTINQDQTELNLFEASDLLVSTCTASINESHSIEFHHKMSSIILNINSAIEPSSIMVSSKVSVNSDLKSNIYGSTGNNADITPYRISRGKYKVIIAPDSFNAGDVFITAIVGGETFEWKFDNNTNFASGNQYDIIWQIGNQPPGEDGDARYSGWAELPAEDHSKTGDYYYVYHMRPDAPKIRNFSACYSKDNMSPVWVAAPLHSSYISSTSRTDAYDHDPQIPFNQAGSWGSPYNRGHMLKSSARTVSRATNEQVFYYSNIAPQYISGFNTGGGVWNNLEDYENTLMCSDTLYTVHGAHWTNKNNIRQGNYAAEPTIVPTHFYKVFLRTKSGNTGKSVLECTREELICVAFYIDHNTSQHKVYPNSSMMISVSQLEQITGHKFFSNVPNAPKDTFNASDWNL